MEKMNFSLKKISVIVSFIFIVCSIDQCSADENENATYRAVCFLSDGSVECKDEKQNTYRSFGEVPETTKVLTVMTVTYKSSHFSPVKNLANVIELEVRDTVMLSQDFLQTMQNLETLTITYGWFQENDLSNITLRLPKLKTLRFTSYSSQYLPFDFYCSFPRLEKLIIGYAILSDILDFPCGINSSCCSHLNLIEIKSFTDYNRAHHIALGAFVNLPNLKVLRIDKMRIKFPSNLTEADVSKLTDLQIPMNYEDMDSLSHLKSLTRLWVHGSFRHGSRRLNFDFQNLPQLTVLYLKHGSIEHIGSNSFKNCTKLAVLNLSFHNISSLTNTEESGKVLNILTTDGLPRLEYLILTDNEIHHLDYSMIPESVKVLDVSHNPLSSLSGNVTSCRNHALKELHMSCVLLWNLEDLCFPPFLEVISLKESQISRLSSMTFSSLNNLKEFLLDGNNLLKVDLFALSSNYRSPTLANISVEFECSCSRVQKPFRNLSVVPVMNDESDRRCQYSKTCSRSGQKYVKTTTSNCRRLMLKEFPMNLLKDSNEIYLDGNNLITVDFDSILQHFSELNILDLNQSNIRQIEMTDEHRDNVINSFEELHLEDNFLESLPKSFFIKLTKFTSLHLQRNSFKQFKILINKTLSLDEIHLENNSISEFVVENQFFISYSIKTVYLQFNEFSKINKSFCDYKIYTLHLEYNKISELDFACSYGSRLKLLYLQNNHLTILNSSAFNNLPNLQELNLEGSRIRQIKNKAFSRLQRLKRLNLRRNKIEWIDEGMFDKVNNLEVLNLDENSLVEIPPLVFKDLVKLQTLFLHRNKITTLSLGLFKNNEELKEINLEENFIGRIDLSVFQHLHSLISLHLNNNNISEIISHPSIHLLSLEELHLNENQLKKLNGEEFTGMINMTKLFLHHNEIHHVEKDTFKNLTSLEILTLHENKLKHPGIWNFGLSKTIKNLTIHQNPLVCECEYLKELRSFLSSNHYISNISVIKCFSTENEEYSIDQSDDIIFRLCQSKSSANRIIGLSVSIGFLLLIGFISVFIFKYRLAIQVILYSRFKVRFCYDESKDEGKQYHAFVAYSFDDRAFVADELVPRLGDYRICIHDRDFVIGLFIQENIINAVNNSCCTLMIFSNSFVNSEWCRYEFRTAYEKTRKDRWRRILVILMEDVNPDDLEDEMQFYLSTTTYLRWGDPLFWEKLYYALPSPNANDRERNRRQQNIPLQQLN